MKSFNCMWKHCCEESRVCCHFCKKKTCEWRCNDNHEKCKYKETDNFSSIPEKPIDIKEIKIRTHNEFVDKKVQEKLKRYKKENKLHEDVLSERIGIKKHILSKVLSADSLVKIRSDSYEKIKGFLRGVQTSQKRKLW